MWLEAQCSASEEFKEIPIAPAAVTCYLSDSMKWLSNNASILTFRWQAALLHGVGRLLLIGALLGMPQPMIVCSCGTEFAHPHTAFGFDLFHHHYETGTFVDPSDDTETSVASGDERVSSIIFAACLTAVRLVGIVFGRTSLLQVAATSGVGLTNCPDPPPPRADLTIL